MDNELWNWVYIEKCLKKVYKSNKKVFLKKKKSQIKKFFFFFLHFLYCRLKKKEKRKKEGFIVKRFLSVGVCIGRIRSN